MSKPEGNKDQKVENNSENPTISPKIIDLAKQTD